jgi:hypothetical protein
MTLAQNIRQVIADHEYDLPPLGRWVSRAACAGADTVIFQRNDERNAAAMRSICATCPVIADCYDHGLAHEQHGSWGGLTQQELRAERATTRAAQDRAAR